MFIVACGGSDSPEPSSTTAAPTATTASTIEVASSTATSAPQATATATAPSASEGVASTATSVPETTASQTSSGAVGETLGLEEALNELTALYEELVVVLSKVTDEASARAVVDDMARIAGRFEDLDELMNDFSEEEITNAFLSGRLAGFSQEFTNEMIRISSDPALFGFLSEAFENFNPH